MQNPKFTIEYLADLDDPEYQCHFEGGLAVEDKSGANWAMRYFTVDTLGEAEQAARNAMRGQVYFNIYLQDLMYGGPEEGGWWYTVSTPAFETMPTLLANMDEFHKKYEECERHVSQLNHGRPDISSVLSEGKHTLIAEWLPGKATPRRRPRYE
jgi:hypothetical protein